MKALYIATALVSLFLPLQGTGADLEKGLEAAKKGDFQTALKEWAPLAAQGFASAQFNLGAMYDNGEGVPEDDKEAVKWFRLAAEQGDANAQSNLGVMYDNGRGVPEDNIMAYMWWNLAAASGHKSSVENKQIISEKMTKADISKAQELSRQWVTDNQ